MIYFIALICFLLPSYLVRFSVFSIPTTLLEVLIYLAAILTIAAQILNSKSDHSTSSGRPEENRTGEILNKSKIQNHNLKNLLMVHNLQLIIPIILFLSAGIISVMIAPDKREALGLFKAYIFDPIIFFLIIIINLSEKKEIRNPKSEILNKSKIPNPKLEIGNWKLEILIKSLILSGMVVALQAIWQKITGQVQADGRVVGIFGYSPNYLSFYLVPLAVLAGGYGLNLLDSSRNNLRKNRNVWLYVLAFLLILAAIWLSGSRAALGAVLVAISLFFIIKYWSFIKAKKILIVLLYCYLTILLAVAWQITKPDWSATRDAGRISSSNNVRWEIWETTVEDILPKDNNWLLGVGLGNYQNYFSELTKDRGNYPEWISPLALSPHNLFLTIWLNLGLLGLIGFLWIIYSFFSQLISGRASPYRLILLTVMATIIIQGLVDSPYWKNDLAVAFWIFLALNFIGGVKDNG